ncbi:hypothetical protein ACHAPJ_002083 [Fusarium lateritium]
MPLIRSRQSDESITGWRDDPDGRGTLGIIWSCILTLALCVWSALHLNIPPKGNTVTQYWLRVLRWVLLGILAPELVLWAAWRQWKSAKLLTAEMQKVLKETKSNPGQSKRRHGWTQLHSFYVCMGGFVIDADEELDVFPNSRRLTFSPSAVLLLAKCGQLPDIDPLDIKDKSKADSLAKFIVLLQATWFLVQTLARIAQSLPISLLEVNTIGHVLCALVIYLLWWHKPREVSEPTVLRGEGISSLASFMYMSSRISGVQYRRGIRPPAWISPELENLVYAAPSDGENTNAAAIESTDDTIVDSSPPDQESQRHQRSISENPLGGFRAEIRRQETAHTAERKRKLGWEVDEKANDTNTSRLARHRLCAQAIRDYPSVQEYFSRKTPDSSDFVPQLHQFVVPNAINWPTDFLLRAVDTQVVGMVLWFVSIMYGSVHLAAWKEFFPSDVERLLWHMSAGYIAASGVWWTVAHILFYLWPWLGQWWDRFVKLRCHWSQYVVYGFLMMCAGTLYILTRIYLTIEGIVSLRAAPESMYDTVEWLDFVPHF